MKKVTMFLLSILLLAISPPVFALHFQKSVETLNKITEIISKKEKGVYLRFGDGDVVLSVGINDANQLANTPLQEELNEAFALNGPNVLKCLPLHCRELGGYEQGMFEGKHETPFAFCLDLLKMAGPKWNAEFGDVYSMTALAFAATDNLEFCIQFLKFLKQSKCCVFVGNCNIPSSIRELLFGSQCQFVPTPARNSYFEIDRIERECIEKIKNIEGYKVIVTSMGCSGRALQKRLWNQLENVFLFDFGSLMDAICGWNTRDWIPLSRFDAQKFIQILEKELAHIDQPQEGEIRVVCTSALVQLCYESRKNEYIQSFKTLTDYGYPPYVFEACHPAPPSFLEEYAASVFYSNVNDPKLVNKGVNEAKSIMEGFKHYQFNPNDMIVKITGRYHLDRRNFLQIIEDHPEVEAFVSCDPGYPEPLGKVFTGCYAMRYQLFKEMLENLSFEEMEKKLIDIEVEVANFAQKLTARGAKVMYLDKIGMTANIGGPCPAILSYW